MPTNSHFKAQYDEEGNIVLTSLGEQEVYQERHAERSELVRPEADEQAESKHVARHKISSLARCFDFAIPHFVRNRSAQHDAFGALRFVGTFAGVFLLIFITLNFPSYSQMFKAKLLPDVGQEDRLALHQITNPIGRDKLLAVPHLPRAGVEDALPIAPSVAPPDNRLVIPKLGKNIPVVAASDAALIRGDWKMFESDIQNSLLFGVVHYPGTAEPGQIGNVFLTGHSSNYPWIMSRYNAVFALLPQLQVGDEYSLFFEGELHRYRITGRKEVSPRDVTVLDQPHDRYMSTLMTCTPVGTTLKRLILEADEVDPETGELLAVGGGFDEMVNGIEDWGEELPM